MSQGLRTAITVSVLGLILVIGAAWGYSSLTEPFPGKVDAPLCTNVSVAQGDKVYADQVVVSVYNAGTREGLAGRTMQLFTDKGFTEGDSGNAPDKAEVATAEVWAKDPKNPAVQLVAAKLGPGTEIRRRATEGVGVTVIVGDDFTKLVKGKSFIRSAEDATICSPSG
ncbi:LytR C-terminal domain-containing protein [Nocardioides sp. KIGAM211]|uniref:LytR C-terminal domain-containing protein n=1 Tax=Nocardioides luti TaxID=2761101 RepID=A0A7X0VAK4_9ACTN|nr:LytR C-terminal domain-containing protein [Nocardioides luti]MBB6627686.1 LytR C-terminal domain-containing protein [Nocardioides luti]